jgi:integrase
MATITKRGTSWYVQVRRKGFPPRNRTLRSRVEAVAWARSEETALDLQGGPVPQAPQMTLGALLERYRDTITPMKRSASSESSRLSRMIVAPMAAVGLNDLRPAHIAAYRDTRLRQVMPGTVRREMAVLRSALEVARREWELMQVNPAANVTRPIVHDGRDRRLQSGEWERLQVALKSGRNRELAPFLMLAVETALRRGELLRLSWQHVDLERGVALIPETKTGQSRTIPLTPDAARVLGSLPRREGRVFHLTATAVQQAWRRLCHRAGIANLRIHDLRHEALSRFSELGLNTPELAAISGHRDVRMLLRYTHVQPTQLAAKLARLTADTAGH